MRQIEDASDLLDCATPSAWFDRAEREVETLLIDHANCEKKAAGTALSMLYRYVDKPRLLRRMSRLAREELRHYEQVLAMIDRLGFRYGHVSPSRYAGSMRSNIRTSEPGRLIDSLLVGAVVEARSCERFAGLARRFDGALARFYERLVEAERRHALVYFELAAMHSDKHDADAIESRLKEIVSTERVLITAPDSEFRFHSGAPTQSVAV
ncbi:MAG TPA: tRNA-(ms[2]io[6]A)-hydroxylase [Pseudomonadales bacterium]|nr:tRNA-(ms[2]io[6]A)-hydroxylase [Pseudomonadales bacterium]